MIEPVTQQEIDEIRKRQASDRVQGVVPPSSIPDNEISTLLRAIGERDAAIHRLDSQARNMRDDHRETLRRTSEERDAQAKEWQQIISDKNARETHLKSTIDAQAIKLDALWKEHDKGMCAIVRSFMFGPIVGGKRPDPCGTCEWCLTEAALKGEPDASRKPVSQQEIDEIRGRDISPCGMGLTDQVQAAKDDRRTLLRAIDERDEIIQGNQREADNVKG